MLSLAVKSLWNTRWRYTILMLPIIVGCASVYTVSVSYHLTRSFLDTQAENQIQSNQIIATKKSNGIALLLGDAKQNTISAAEMKSLAEIPNIQKISFQKILQKPSSVQVDFLGNRFESDAPIIVIDPDILEPDLREKNANTNDILPVFLSKDLLNVLNSGLADSLGIPHLNENLLLGKNITLLVGYSSFVNTNKPEDIIRIPAIVAGFSSRVPLVGISITEENLKKYELSTDQFPLKINSLIIEPDTDSNLESLRMAVEKIGLETDTLSQRLGKIQSRLAVVTSIVSIFVGILIFFAMITVASIVSSDISQQTSFIGLSRCFGAKPRDIFLLFLGKISIITILSSVIGVILGSYLQYLLLRVILPNLLVITQKIPLFLDIPTAIIICSGTLLLSLLASLPALRHSGKISPISALQQ